MSNETPTQTPDQIEAIEAVDDVWDYAKQRDWRMKQRGCNKIFAFATMTRDLDDRYEAENEQLQVFYAVDPDARDDKFVHGSTIIDRDALRGIMDGEDAPETEAEASAQEEYDDAHAVPPTSAAHQHVVPPTSNDRAAHSDVVPPTEEWPEGLHEGEMRAAHTEQDDAAHPKGKAHGAYSTFTNVELLKMVNGKEVFWRNRLSGRIDSATVSKVTKDQKWKPHITPSNWDEQNASQSEDLRILHFLEVGASFRSVAIAQITSIK